MSKTTLRIMVRGKRFLGIGLLCVAGCPGTDCDVELSPDVAVLEAPARVDFGSCLAGASCGREFRLANRGTRGLTIRGSSLPADAPFQVDLATPLTLAPDESVAVRATFMPVAPGAAQHTLELTSDADGAEHHQVALLGTAEDLPDCDDGNPCTLDSFDVATDTCSSVPVSAPCDDGNACTEGDTCAEGACVGTVRHCDDGIACTVDTCDRARGCAHVAVSAACDDGNPCTTDFCDATLGCRSTVAEDGTPCGRPDGCSAWACLRGACTALPLPMELADATCPSRCGNSVREADEECDGDDLGGLSCEGLQLLSGHLGCAADCTLDASGCIPPAPACGWPAFGSPTTVDADVATYSCGHVEPYPARCPALCGNGVRDWCRVCDNDTGDCSPPLESCDGVDLGDESCRSLGFVRGELRCSSRCELDTSRCDVCGSDPHVVACGAPDVGGLVGWPLAIAAKETEIAVAAGLGYQGATSFHILGADFQPRSGVCLPVSSPFGVAPLHDGWLLGVASWQEWRWVIQLHRVDNALNTTLVTEAYGDATTPALVPGANGVALLLWHDESYTTQAILVDANGAVVWQRDVGGADPRYAVHAHGAFMFLGWDSVSYVQTLGSDGALSARTTLDMEMSFPGLTATADGARLTWIDGNWRVNWQRLDPLGTPVGPAVPLGMEKPVLPGVALGENTLFLSSPLTEDLVEVSLLDPDGQPVHPPYFLFQDPHAYVPYVQLRTVRQGNTVVAAWVGSNQRLILARLSPEPCDERAPDVLPPLANGAACSLPDPRDSWPCGGGCGNGVRDVCTSCNDDGCDDVQEECDGNDVVTTCEGMGYTGGLARCHAWCVPDPSSCIPCLPEEHVVRCGNLDVEATKAGKLSTATRDGQVAVTWTTGRDTRHAWFARLDSSLNVVTARCLGLAPSTRGRILPGVDGWLFVATSDYASPNHGRVEVFHMDDDGVVDPEPRFATAAWPGWDAKASSLSDGNALVTWVDGSGVRMATLLRVDGTAAWSTPLPLSRDSSLGTAVFTGDRILVAAAPQVGRTTIIAISPSGTVTADHEVEGWFAGLLWPEGLVTRSVMETGTGWETRVEVMELTSDGEPVARRHLVTLAGWDPGGLEVHHVANTWFLHRDTVTLVNDAGGIVAEPFRFRVVTSPDTERAYVVQDDTLVTAWVNGWPGAIGVARLLP
ncbi:MAG: hypothetical protein AB2A00_09560 [Myxococcota bacterium]